MIHKGKKMKLPITKEWILKYDYFGMAQSMFSKVEKHIKPNMIMLDVGTGNGVATRFLLSKIKKPIDKGSFVYSIDLSEELHQMIAEIIEEEGFLDFVKLQIANVENLPFNDGFFDLILSVNSFHHFSDQLKAVNEMKRVLKNDGVICIIDWSKKARFLPHKKEEMYNLEDFKILINNEVIDEYSERYWWFVAFKK